MQSMRTWIGVAALVVCSGACATNQKDGQEITAAPEQTPVEITNNNWADVVIYAVRLGARYRLGMVTSMSQQVLQVPRAMYASADGISLLADPIGSDDVYQTQPIITSPDEAIVLLVQNDLNISSYSVQQRSLMLARHSGAPHRR